MSNDKQNGSAVARSSQQARTLFHEGLGHQKSGDLNAAVECYNKVLRINPEATDALNNLGVALRAMGKRAEAATTYRRLLAIAPPTAKNLINLGNVLRELGQFDECTFAFSKAIELDPKVKGAVYGLGLVSRDCNQLTESLAYLERALEDEPRDADLNWDRAQTLLRMGDYEPGFEAYEWRAKLERTAKRQFEKPEWDGSALGGRTLLLYGEQGFGDAIQFARFIPELAKTQATEVILEVRPELTRLFEGQLSGVKKIIARGDEFPDYDCRLSLMSVPRVLKTQLDTLPCDSYLKPKDGLTALPAVEKGALRIGLAWAGSPTQGNDRNRSFSLQDMLPLFELAQCRFFSLQKGAAEAELAELGVRHAITPLGPVLKDFADTSAVMDELDLVITADTSVAHLAGAMGKQVWIALSVFHDWRYDATGSISAWYPSARVFKQDKPGDWRGVFGRMKQELGTSF